MKLFKASARNFHSIQLLGSSNQKVVLSRPFGNLGIGISALAWSLTSALRKIYFCLQNFFLKIEYLCYYLCLVMVSVPLCYKYLFLYDFLFIYSKASIGVLEKGYLNIRRHLSIGVLRKQLLRKLLHTLHTFQRNIQGGVLFKYISCYFVLLLKYWNSFALTFVAAECKRFLDFSYM